MQCTGPVIPQRHFIHEVMTRHSETDFHTTDKQHFRRAIRFQQRRFGQIISRNISAEKYARRMENKLSYNTAKKKIQKMTCFQDHTFQETD